MTQTNYEKALTQALKSAYSSLRERDLKEVAFKSGASCSGDGPLQLTYLNQTVTIEADQETVILDSTPLDLRNSILILHYLNRASGAPLTGQMISFKETPQGGLYYQPFRNRVILPMLALLEKDRARFEECATEWGGEKIQTGDLSYRFRVFPYSTTQYVWYQGEETIPADLNFLFDSAVSEYLSTEDIVVMCEELNQKLKSCFSMKGSRP